MWEIPQFGTGSTWGGLISTAGGLVFYCDDSGASPRLTPGTGSRCGTPYGPALARVAHDLYGGWPSDVYRPMAAGRIFSCVAVTARPTTAVNGSKATPLPSMASTVSGVTACLRIFIICGAGVA